MAGFFDSLYGASSGSQTTSGSGLGKRQRQLINMQMELAGLQLDAVRSAINTGQTAGGADGGTAPGQLVQDQIQFFQDELKRIEPGGDPEQQRLIQESADRAIESGLIDVERVRTQSIDDLLGRIAPSRGLRPGDSPIVDRGGNIIAESVRQAGQLTSGIRGQQADFERQLREQAFNNRLTLGAALGDIGQNQQKLGMGLASGVPSNVGGTLAAISGSRGSTTDFNGDGSFGQGLKNVSGLAAGAGSLISAGNMASQGNYSFSAEELKDIEGPERRKRKAISTKDILEAVKRLDIRAWKYRIEAREALGLDSARHVGPMAGDWQREMTRATRGPIGDGLTINMTDAVGASLAAIQAMGKKIDKLERAA